jgi:peptide/nickel transport system ATP-binding protein
MTEVALEVDGLGVALASGQPVVEDVSIALRRGEVLGLVGESGSGKTTTALALLGYCKPGLSISRGRIMIGDQPVLDMPDKALRRLRGHVISYVPQDPGAALNPSLRLRDQLSDMLVGRSGGGVEDAGREALARANLPADREFLARYPHQLSGGQQQRLAIALALVAEPDVVVLDEPTTGLDVVTQAHILREVDELRRANRLSVVYVSHDLAVVATVADRIAVMYAGRIVEEGPTATVLTVPRHPYTRGLLNAIPDHVVPRRVQGIRGIAVGVGDRGSGCAFAPRCDQQVPECLEAVPMLESAAAADHLVRCLRWQDTPALASTARANHHRAALPAVPLLEVDELSASYRSGGRTVTAANGVSFAISPGECVALVGESGSGKTTIARCIVGLHRPARGEIRLDGVPLPERARDRSVEMRRRVQIVFQNPNESLNPYHTVEEEILRPAYLLRRLTRRAAADELSSQLAKVRLPSRLARRYPRELSGGERQRVAIARALAAEPDLILCDEVTSALDASVQAAVMELLTDLQRELGLALLFISHDLAVVASIAQRVVVLERGVIREDNRTQTVLANPSADYTRALISAAPRVPRVG